MFQNSSRVTRQAQNQPLTGKLPSKDFKEHDPNSITTEPKKWVKKREQKASRKSKEEEKTAKRSPTFDSHLLIDAKHTVGGFLGKRALRATTPTFDRQRARTPSPRRTAVPKELLLGKGAFPLDFEDTMIKPYYGRLIWGQIKYVFWPLYASNGFPPLSAQEQALLQRKVQDKLQLPFRTNAKPTYINITADTHDPHTWNMLVELFQRATDQLLYTKESHLINFSDVVEKVLSLPDTKFVHTLIALHSKNLKQNFKQRCYRYRQDEKKAQVAAMATKGI